MARDVSLNNLYISLNADLLWKGNKLASGVLFAVLLNFKHIYMYLAVCAPVFICLAMLTDDHGISQLTLSTFSVHSVCLRKARCFPFVSYL